MALQETKSVALTKISYTYRYEINMRPDGTVEDARSHRQLAYFDGAALIASRPTESQTLAVDKIPEIVAGLAKLDQISDEQETAAKAASEAPVEEKP